MNDRHHEDQVVHGVRSHSALPTRLLSHEVPVRGALSRTPEWRSVVRVCEWMVEPVVDTGEFSLTLVLSENVSLSFLLSTEDAQDLGATLTPRGQDAGTA